MIYWFMFLFQTKAVTAEKVAKQTRRGEESPRTPEKSVSGFHQPTYHLTYHSSPSPQYIVELQRAQRQLQAKNREISALAEEVARLKQDKEKFEDELKDHKRARAKERTASLTAVSSSVHATLHNFLTIYSSSLLLSPISHSKPKPSPSFASRRAEEKKKYQELEEQVEELVSQHTTHSRFLL